jgi:hypothetical protein
MEKVWLCSLASVDHSFACLSTQATVETYTASTFINVDTVAAEQNERNALPKGSAPKL